MANKYDTRYGAYAGSFDPITKGHLWVIGEAIKLFDEVHVYVSDSPTKKYTFSKKERMEMVEQACKEAFPDRQFSLHVESVANEYIVERAYRCGVEFVVRGVRTVADYEYERGMAEVNLGINPKVQTVIFFPPANLATVSSSAVKGLIGPKGWDEVVSPFVPSNVLTKLKSKFADDILG